MSDIYDPFSLGKSDKIEYTEEKKKKHTFDFVKNIEIGGENLFETYPEITSDYSQYLVENHFFKKPDCILYVNEMNKLRGILSDELHYNYFKSVIPKSKSSFFRKKKVVPNLDALNKIIEYYNCSLRVAKMYLRILKKDQLEKLILLLDKGGK